MNKREFIVYVDYSEKSREISDGVIEHAIKDYLDSVSGFYYDNIKVKEIKNSETSLEEIKNLLDNHENRHDIEAKQHDDLVNSMYKYWEIIEDVQKKINEMNIE